jgi:hypothetical protein
MTTIKISAHCTTGKEPMTVYTSLQSYLSAYKVHTNCKAYLNGQQYWIDVPKIVGNEVKY